MGETFFYTWISLKTNTCGAVEDIKKYKITQQKIETTKVTRNKYNNNNRTINSQ